MKSFKEVEFDEELELRGAQDGKEYPGLVQWNGQEEGCGAKGEWTMFNGAHWGRGKRRREGELDRQAI